MLRVIRRYAVVSMRHGFKLMAAFLLLGWGTTFLGPRPVAAVVVT